jgi:hypothetical protein
MPQGDRTGPNGQGPMTGRGMGFCSGSNTPGYMNPRSGRGMGRGFGRGRGFGFRQDFVQLQVQPQVITEAQEKEMLKQELEAIKAEQSEIEAQLKKLK